MLSPSSTLDAGVDAPGMANLQALPVVLGMQQQRAAPAAGFPSRRMPRRFRVSGRFDVSHRASYPFFAMRADFAEITRSQVADVPDSATWARRSPESTDLEWWHTAGGFP